MANLQQRSLSKQFEQMELKQELQDQKAETSGNGFVVNALTTATQRASSKSSIGSSIGSFANKKLTCVVKAGMDIAHASNTNLALNGQNSTATNFSSGAATSGEAGSQSSGVINNALKKNQYLNQLTAEISNMYIPSGAQSKVASQPLSLNASVGAAVHREAIPVAPPKVISCTKPSKSA
jgi:hypothetical protein